MAPRAGKAATVERAAVLPPEETAALAARADERETRSYAFCGRTLALRCDCASFAARFERTFRLFRRPPADAGDGDRPAASLTFLTRAVGPDGSPALLEPATGALRVFGSGDVPPTALFQAMAFVDEPLFPLPDHAVFHASVIERGGAVTVLAGRAHSGKTTLALAAALEPGVRLLSDEFCPIRLADGAVEPFPRALGVRPRTLAMLAARGAIERGAGTARRDGRTEVDPAAIRGIEIGRGGRVASVVLVSGEAGEPGPAGLREVEVESVSDGLLADLRALPGVRAVSVRPDRVSFGRTLRFEVAPGARVTEEVTRVIRQVHGVPVLGILAPGGRAPDFSSPPRLLAVPTFDGLVELLRHLANRSSLARGMDRPSQPRFLDVLARLVGTARFHVLRPGPVPETVALLLRAVLADDRAGPVGRSP